MKFPYRLPRHLMLTQMLACAAVPSMASEEGKAQELRPIVVTAAAVEVDSLTAPASITVVTREDLEKGEYVDLTDALRNVPGVAVAGAADGENIFIRGLPSEFTLILVDGKRVNTRESRTNASGGVDQFYTPPISAIERIEIVRGPMSSLYGSDAMGGVINIITRPVASEWVRSLTLGGSLPQDSDDSMDAQASFYLNGPLLKDTLGLQTWGRMLARSESKRVRGTGERELSDLHGRLTWDVDPDHELSLELGTTRIDTDPRLNFRHDAALGYEGLVMDWETTAGLSHEHAGRITDGSNRKPEVDNSIVDAKASRFFDNLGGHLFTFGGQFSRAVLIDQNPGRASQDHDRFSNLQSALFLEDIWELHPRFDLTFGGRFTYDERFGTKVLPRAYGVFQGTESLFLTLGAGTGYRTPELREFVEDYFLTTNRGAAVIPGNPNLEPEESITYEAGIRYDGGRSRFSATVFHTDFKNKIETRDTGQQIVIDGTNFDLFEYFNVGEARIRGLEISGGTFLTPTIEVSGSYTLTDSEQLTGALRGQPLARTPEHQFGVRVDWATPVDDLAVWGSANYIGDSVAITTGGRGNVITRNEGYTLIDFGSSYRLHENVMFNATVYNLANKGIENSVHGTVERGRTFWASLTFDY